MTVSDVWKHAPTQRLRCITFNLDIYCVTVYVDGSKGILVKGGR
jgi:hypothetical protein